LTVVRIAMFVHSILSDWNHGNAHFLRGVATELVLRGHRVRTFESREAWSVSNMMREQGAESFASVREIYPHLAPTRYDLATLDLDEALDRVDLVLVHEWSPHDLVRRVGVHRAKGAHYKLLFHDTHHRAVTDPKAMAAYALEHYDGVLAFGEALRRIYETRGWGRRAWTWHEAADTRVFRPKPDVEPSDDLVWIGNWGDEERTRELEEFLLGPIRALSLRARVYGVRYPSSARAALREARIEYGGWLPNFKVPDVFARYRVTAHVPRRPYVAALPGIPTIRPFEALACGIPLVSAPWDDTEGLFSPDDFLVARTGDEMRAHLRTLLSDPARAREIARHGRRTVLARHTCSHRVDELLGLCAELGVNVEPTRRPGASEPCGAQS
jgi:spore maturation protein CgeB